MMIEKVAPEDIEEKASVFTKKHKCKESPPGIPQWMAIYSDMVTLLLTFFVLLLSFAKTETAKYESALGSIRNAFGGNIFKQGEVLQLGKSPDNQTTMLEVQNPIKPFPIDFLTVDGFLDKHEVNRESAEDLKQMRESLDDFKLTASSAIYEMPEGIKVHIREKILFQQGSSEFADVNVEIFKRLLNIMRTEKWKLFVQGHSSRGEKGRNGRLDALGLSALRAEKVAKALIERGVLPEKITSVFYGDSMPNAGYENLANVPPRLTRRVDFILRKIDLNHLGHRVK